MLIRIGCLRIREFDFVGYYLDARKIGYRRGGIFKSVVLMRPGQVRKCDERRDIDVEHEGEKS